jgi:hypothetical protein
MKAVIGEYLWQADLIERQPDAILVSIRPEMSFEFTRRHLNYRECSELCKHDIFWAAYPEFVNNISVITGRLDQILWATDSRFSQIGLPIFDRLGYIIKMNHDQSVYYAHLIRELINQGVDTIACADNGGPALYEYGMFESGMSIIPEIVRAFGSDGPKLELMVPPPHAEQESTPRLSFGQPIKLVKKIGAENLYNAYCELQFQIRSRIRNQQAPFTVLSVGCKEVDALDESSLHKVRLLKYHPEMEYVGGSKKWPYLAEFCDLAAHDSEINRLLHYRGANLTGLIMHGISFLADKLEHILNKYTKIHAFLDRRQVNFVVFQTMAPLYLPNIIIQHWCRKRNVPFACWMHGGYGAYESLQGYDVTDYRISPQHLVYGQVLANLPKNPNWVLHKLGYSGYLKEIHVAGSPFFERLYKDYRKQENPRKKVLFCLGNYYNHNQFYFGHNRENSEISIWSAHKRILEVLVKFQNKYDICVKDYPDSPQKEMWLKVLRILNAENITYVTSERPFSDILVEADLHIFSWVSTTFFQSMFTEADICLYDNTDLTTETRTLFEQNLVFGTELVQFCNILEDYLKTGNFYLQPNFATIERRRLRIP